jgi:AraC-like DNA-binding protein
VDRTSLENVYPVGRPPFDSTLRRAEGGLMSGNEKPVVPHTYWDNRVPIDRRIQSILRAIESDPSADIVTLARMINLSPSRLSHLFKRETRHGLHSFLAECRLEKAARLLARTHTPVKEVSYIVGYSHAASFVRAFRKKFGCTPNSYRGDASTFATKDSYFG